MTVFTDVDPTTFAEVQNTAYEGRSAWRRRGFDYLDYRYKLSPRGVARAGAKPEVDLDHWAVAAGVAAIRDRLVELGLVDEPEAKYVGRFGAEMESAVKEFQLRNTDVETDRPLAVDGIVGRVDAKALFTPIIDAAEKKYRIPNHLVRGMINNESLLDPGAIGSYCWYFRDGKFVWGGVDRGLHQSNSKARSNVSWLQAFQPRWALETAAEELRKTFDALKAKYPGQTDAVYWDAAVCSHNSPVNGRNWAQAGAATNIQAATYVGAVKKMVY